MMLFKIGGIGLGIIIALWGFNENKLNDNISEAPESVSMVELEKGDYTGSNHIEISDFVYLYYQLVYEAKIGKFETDVKSDSKLTHVYIPIVSTEHSFVGQITEFISQLEQDNENVKEPDLKDYTVLVKTRKYKTVADLPVDFAVAENPVQGIFVNKISSISNEEKEFLRQGCPGIDLDKVLILEEGRTPSSSAAAYGAIVVGFLVSLFFIFLLFKRKKVIPQPSGVSYQ